MIEEVWQGAYYCPNPNCYTLKKDKHGKKQPQKTLWSHTTKSKKYWLYVCTECDTTLRITKGTESE